MGQKLQLTEAHLISWAVIWRDETKLGCAGIFWGSWSLLKAAAAWCSHALSQGNWPQEVGLLAGQGYLGSWECVCSDLHLLTASWSGHYITSLPTSGVTGCILPGFWYSQAVSWCLCVPWVKRSLKQWSLAFQQVQSFSCVKLALFLSLGSDLQSLGFSTQSLSALAGMQTHISDWRGVFSSNLYPEFLSFCLPQIYCCPILCGIKVSPCLCPGGGFQVCRNFSSFTIPSRCAGSIQIPLSPFLLFFLLNYFTLLLYREISLPFWKLKAFASIQWVSWRSFSACRCILMYLWGERWSPCVLPLPYFLNLLYSVLNYIFKTYLCFKAFVHWNCYLWNHQFENLKFFLCYNGTIWIYWQNYLHIGSYTFIYGQSFPTSMIVSKTIFNLNMKFN